LLSQLAEMLAHEFGVLKIERTGVRLLFWYADRGQIVD